MDASSCPAGNGAKFVAVIATDAATFDSFLLAALNGRATSSRSGIKISVGIRFIEWFISQSCDCSAGRDTETNGVTKIGAHRLAILHAGTKSPFADGIQRGLFKFRS